ncbi:hypothetical protein AAHE18_04G021400 [Arachis hypogaea]
MRNTGGSFPQTKEKTSSLMTTGGKKKKTSECNSTSCREVSEHMVERNKGSSWKSNPEPIGTWVLAEILMPVNTEKIVVTNDDSLSARSKMNNLKMLARH